ncbi:hypothetical protein HJC10_09960 [Corallococcus exiguus]|nr:hypothetical protein [Corallococcus exiguus]
MPFTADGRHLPVTQEVEARRVLEGPRKGAGKQRLVRPTKAEAKRELARVTNV